jgi:hypothetical protein
MYLYILYWTTGSANISSRFETACQMMNSSRTWSISDDIYWSCLELYYHNTFKRGGYDDIGRIPFRLMTSVGGVLQFRAEILIYCQWKGYAVTVDERNFLPTSELYHHSSKNQVISFILWEKDNKSSLKHPNILKISTSDDIIIYLVY